MKTLAYRFIVNMAFLKEVRNRDTTNEELTKMIRDFRILWIFSIILSAALSGYLYLYYQLPLLWCIVLLFFNSMIIPIFYCLIYDSKAFDYHEFFTENYMLIREQYKRAIDSVTSWFLVCLLPINIFNSYVYGESSYESLINIFFLVYLFIAFTLYFLRKHSLKTYF